MTHQPTLFDELDTPPPPDSLGVATIGLRPGSKVLSAAKGIIAGAFDYSLNPYVGCGFACSYCYAANFVADEQKKEDWGKWVDIKVDAAEQIARANLRGKRIMMSSATDPYQPLELRVGLTRGILEALLPQQPILTVQTRSPIVSRDIDLLRQFQQVRVNMSITTDSEEVRKRFEPSCASIDRRFEALADFAAAGIPVNVCISPMLPIENPRAFARRILALGPARVYAGFFHSSDRQFAAATRPGGLSIAREFGWTRERYLATLRELCEYLPMLKPWDRDELPARRPLKLSA